MSDHHPVDMPLKVATRLLIERVGGLEAAASCTRIGKSQLANCQSPHSDQYLPIDVVCRLEQIVGEPMVTKELARRSEHRLEPLGAVEPACAVRVVSAVAQEANDALQALSAGMVDGVLDDADRARIQGELLDVARVASEGAAALAGGCK